MPNSPRHGEERATPAAIRQSRCGHNDDLVRERFFPYPPRMDARRKRLRFRAWHRGTREADYMIGCFFDRHCASWSETELGWFEALLDEDDVDIMAWALSSQPVPERFSGDQMIAMQKLDYVEIPR